MVIYGNLIDIYHSEFKLLSANKQLLIKIILGGLTCGVNGYCGSLILKYSKNRRVSDYLDKVSKTQKFHRKGKE